MPGPVFGNGQNLVSLIFQFRSNFDEFDDIVDADIATMLMQASLFVDPLIWSRGDYVQALINLAAHYLALKQTQLSSTELGGTGETDLYVGSISIGERRVMFRERRQSTAAEALAGPGEALLSETTYGETYLMLRARNISAVLVV